MEPDSPTGNGSNALSNADHSYNSTCKKYFAVIWAVLLLIPWMQDRGSQYGPILMLCTEYWDPQMREIDFSFMLSFGRIWIWYHTPSKQRVLMLCTYFCDCYRRVRWSYAEGHFTGTQECAIGKANDAIGDVENSHKLDEMYHVTTPGIVRYLSLWLQGLT